MCAATGGTAMTREEFMQHAADAAYLGDTSALRGYVGEVFDDLERLREEVESHRDAGGYAFRGGYIEDASGGRWWSAGLLARTEAERDDARSMLLDADGHIEELKYNNRKSQAEIEMLRGIGCREQKPDEPESGPCGACLRCAEERGAEWALEIALDPSRWPVSKWTPEEVCRDAREKR